MTKKRYSFWLQTLENSEGTARSRLLLPAVAAIVIILLYYIGDGFLVTALRHADFLRGQAYHELVLLCYSGIVILTSAFWRIRWGMIFAIAGFSLVLPHALLIPAYPDPVYRILSWLSINVLLAIVVGGALNTREQQLAYLREIINAQENERHRLARELHDDTAQGLIDTAHAIDELIETSPELPPEVVNQLSELRHELDDILDMTRRAIQGLQPSVIGEVGIKPALLWLCDEFTEDTGIEVASEIDISDEALTEDAKKAAYRIIQEALTNIRKHAEASCVDLKLAYEGAKIHLSISDNGKGFAFPGWGKLRTGGKAGLFGIQQRAAVVHGSFQITSATGQGTTITVKIPAAAPPSVE